MSAQDVITTADVYGAVCGVAERRAEALAVGPTQPGAEGLSFGELLGRAAALRHDLSARDVGRGSIVGVSARDLDLVLVAALAAMAEGAAVHPSPLDIGSAAHDAGIDLLVIAPGDVVPSGISVPTVVVDGRTAPIEPAGPGEPSLVAAIVDRGADIGRVGPAPASPGDLVGVAWSTHALVSTVRATIEALDLGATDRVVAQFDASCDLSLLLGLAALVAGAQVVGLAVDADADTVRRVFASDERTVWAGAPRTVRRCVRRATSDLLAPVRAILLTREPIPLPFAAQLLDRHRPPTVLQGWGHPDSGGLMAIREVDMDDVANGRIPTGRPLPGRSALVLREDTLEPSPTWVAGPLYHVGDSVPTGFPMHPQLEYERFLQHPETGGRMLLSDEWARVLPSGELEVVGSRATRATVAGHRCDVKVVEAALESHPAIAEAAAAVVADTWVVAFVVHAAGEQEPSDAELGAWLRARLPEVLVPRTTTVCDRLPARAGGDLDRTAIRSWVSEVERSAAGASPRAATDVAAAEARMCEIASDALDVAEGIGPDTDLLDLGASSVELIRVVTAIEEEFDFAAELEELFAHPSIATLARQLGGGPTTSRSGSPRPAPRPDLIVDPFEREAFKDQRRHHRTDLGRTGTIALQTRPDDGAPPARRSTRRFAPGPVPAGCLGELLGALCDHKDGSLIRRRYPSAGSAYPVQTYVAVKRDRVVDVPAGVYYHDPLGHELVPTAAGLVLDPRVHVWINRVVEAECAFSVYLVAERAAIDPLYGDLARDFSLIEAGAIAQLLADTAVPLGLGLCSVGDVDQGRLVAPLALGTTHEVVHALVGGLPGDEGPPSNDDVDAVLAGI